MSTHYVEHKKGAPGQIHALAQTSDGYLWIAAPDGLYRFDGVSFERYKPRTGIVPEVNVQWARPLRCVGGRQGQELINEAPGGR